MSGNEKQTQSGCDQCNRSGLSLLLLRPSPISQDNRVAPAGAGLVKVDENTLLAGLIPTGTKDVRYGLRLLRPGYVHMYIPKPPEGVAHWHVYRISNNADLIAQSDPVFSQMPRPAPCQRTGHNALGMRLLPIPQAHLIDTVWIAYSANLWNDNLKAQNQANPEVMQEIHVKQGVANPGSFVPSANALKAQVLECALPVLTINGNQQHDFPFCSLMSQTEQLAQEMEEVAALHPQTAGKQLAIVLRDPVGIAAEFNAMRLRMSDLSTTHLLRPEVRQPLEVNKLIQTLKQSVLPDVGAEEALTAVCPLRKKSAFDRSASTMPTGTEWEALTQDELAVLNDRASSDSPIAHALLAPYRSAFTQEPLGRVIYPDHEERVRKWAQEQADQAWERFAQYYDDEQRRNWLQGLQQTLQAQYLNTLKVYEDNWNRALRSNALGDYFAQHFDEQDTNLQEMHARTGCSAGSIYMEEAALSFTPEPFCVDGEAQRFFDSQLDADIAMPNAIMLRAMVGNQKSLIDILLADPGNGQRDKIYDFIKGLIGEYTGAKAHLGQPLTPAMGKAVSWLTNINMGFSLGMLGALGAAATNSMASTFERIIGAGGGVPAAPASISPQMLARLNKVQAMTLVHQASEETLKAVLNQKAVAVPVVVMANLSPGQLRQLMIDRGAPMSRRRIRALGKHQVRVAMVINSNTLAELMEAPPSNLRGSVGRNADEVVFSAHAYRYQNIAAGTNGQVLTLPISKLSEIYLEHQAKLSQAPAQVRRWMAEVQNGPSIQAGRKTLLSLDGRLAIGGVILQITALMHGLKDYQSEAGKSAPDARKLNDAWIGMTSAMVGAMGGMAELSATYWVFRTERVQAVSSSVANRSTSVLLLRGTGALLGTVGSFMTAWSTLRAADDLGRSGRMDLVWPMRISAFLFGISGVPLAIVSVDYFLQAAIRAGLIRSGNVAARQASRVAGARVGAGIAARLGVAAAGLSVPGVGWALTAVALGELVYVLINTHDPLQTWFASSYFGKTSWYQSSLAKRGSWEEELNAFNRIDWGTSN
ncbi:T6SS effector BTH_I2691 family protein [Comamonas sp. NoAH]|uniref:T6SS effector BTH_I2691 family protein n=1 Tax=Comamonas halotolerans TaxID=3041496 RepID=UPI0024E1960B|nr:T6SS effector BTH_I2691 family protein [Comamonas sp. NoAH]